MTRIAKLCDDLVKAVKTRDDLAVDQPTQANIASWNVACKRVFVLAMQVIEEAYNER
jgi:hypothetical protein